MSANANININTQTQIKSNRNSPKETLFKPKAYLDNKKLDLTGVRIENSNM